MKRKHLKFIMIVALGILIFQFSIAFKNIEKLSLAQSVEGTWVQTHYASGKYEFTRSKTFLRQNPGLRFNKNGAMVSRANASWCGTPPITYNNYSGSYSINEKDSTIHAIYDFWGGKVDQVFLVKLIGKSELVLESIERKTIKP
ncbi:MAG: hypothetical protein JXQ87_00865 [Bacteroidia bacterium]